MKKTVKHVQKCSSLPNNPGSPPEMNHFLFFACSLIFFYQLPLKYDQFFKITCKSTNNKRTNGSDSVFWSFKENVDHRLILEEGFVCVIPPVCLSVCVSAPPAAVSLLTSLLPSLIFSTLLITKNQELLFSHFTGLRPQFFHLHCYLLDYSFLLPLQLVPFTTFISLIEQTQVSIQLSDKFKQTFCAKLNVCLGLYFLSL